MPTLIQIFTITHIVMAVFCFAGALVSPYQQPTILEVESESNLTQTKKTEGYS